MDIAATLLTGLASASSLFLVSAGLTVIFGVTRVVNFAHGSLCMVGAYAGWSVLTRLPDRGVFWFIVGVLLTVALVAALGAALEMFVLRRVYRAPELLQLLATFGVLLMLQDATLLVWGPAELTLPRAPWMRGFVTIGQSRFPQYDLVLIAAGPVVLGGLWALFRTRWGTLVRAATLDRDMVAALGVDQRWLFTGVFTLGAGLAGLGGVLALPPGSANAGIDLAVITDAFVVVVVGGLGSIGGAYLAAVLLGVAQAFGVALAPQVTLVLVFAVMATVLVVWPRGFLGAEIMPGRDVMPATLLGPSQPWQRWAAAAALLLALLAPFVLGPFALSVAIEALVAILFAASLHLMMGPGGMPSFGHAAWFGLGAYGAALLVQQAGVPMAVALLAAPVLAGAAALAVGAAIVRLSGVYLAMLTLAFAQIVWATASQAVHVTGGENGILGLWPPGWAQGAGYYWLALAVCLGGTLLLRRVVFAPLGYGMRAVRDSPARASAIGLPVYALRLAAFTLAGAAAGLAGGVFAFAKGSVFPAYAGIQRSVDALLMVLLGGVQTVSGPVLGALAYTGLYDGLLRVTDWWRLVLGAVIVALVLLFPQGLGARRG